MIIAGVTEALRTQPISLPRKSENLIQPATGSSTRLLTDVPKS